MKTLKQIGSIPHALSLVFLLMPCVLDSQTTNINTNSSQPGAGTPGAGATNVILYYFTCNVTVGSPSFTSINSFTTTGTYAAGDLVNLKLYQTNFEAFNTTNLRATLSTGLGPGTHTFTFANGLAAAASQRYYWITADFAAGATCGATIAVSTIANASYIITGSKVYGTNNAPGTQTITGGGCTPMPIELLSFEGESSGKKNLLKWSTATETFNDYFTVERSRNGETYHEVKRIKGAGNSLIQKNYEAFDETGSGGLNYYRLKQTDFNGDFSYSPVITIKSEKRREDGLKIYPNPGNGIFSLLTDDPPEAEMDVTVTDLCGKVILNKLFLPDDNKDFDIDFAAPGSYLVKVFSPGSSEPLITRLVKQ